MYTEVIRLNDYVEAATFALQRERCREWGHAMMVGTELLRLATRLIPTTVWILSHQGLAKQEKCSALWAEKINEVELKTSRTSEEILSKLPEALREIVMRCYVLEDRVLVLKQRLYPPNRNPT